MVRFPILSHIRTNVKMFLQVSNTIFPKSICIHKNLNFMEPLNALNNVHCINALICSYSHHSLDSDGSKWTCMIHMGLLALQTEAFYALLFIWLQANCTHVHMLLYYLSHHSCILVTVATIYIYTHMHFMSETFSTGISISVSTYPSKSNIGSIATSSQASIFALLSNHGSICDVQVISQSRICVSSEKSGL